MAVFTGKWAEVQVLRGEGGKGRGRKRNKERGRQEVVVREIETDTLTERLPVICHPAMYDSTPVLQAFRRELYLHCLLRLS